MNDSWNDRPNFSRANFIEPGISDRALSILQIANIEDLGPKPFRYFNHWSAHKDFIPTIHKVWSLNLMGPPIFSLCSKLKALKKEITSFIQEDKEEIQKLKELKGKLHDLQKTILAGSSNVEVLNSERLIRQEVYQLTYVEESIWRQKVRIHWLKSGDQNTTYFHRSVKARQSRNLIRSLRIENGSLVNTIKEIKEVAVNYFEGLLGVEDHRIDPHQYKLERS